MQCMMRSLIESSRSKLQTALWRLILSQIACTVVLAAGVGLLKGWPAGRAAAWGGAAVLIPASLAALRMGMTRPGSAQNALWTQISAQALKWVSTVCVFGGIFLYDREVQALWVFLGFGVVHLAYWLALLLDR